MLSQSKLLSLMSRCQMIFPVHVASLAIIGQEKDRSTSSTYVLPLNEFVIRNKSPRYSVACDSSLNLTFQSALCVLTAFADVRWCSLHLETE